MNLAEIMSSSWYEDGQEVGMKLVMHIAKISGRQFFMTIDDLYDYGSRIFFLSAR